MLLASSGQRVGMLQNVLSCTGQPPPQRIIYTKISVVLRLKSSVVTRF